MISIPHRYRLSPGPTRATVTLLPQEGAHLTVGDDPRPVQSFCHGETGEGAAAPIWFTVFSPAGQAAARIEVAHATTRAPSACHIYFKPGNPDWIWGCASVAGDDLTVLADGEGPHLQSSIILRPSTRRDSPAAPFPSLAASRVSLLDRSDAGNLIFRGNAPLSPMPGSQLIDFDGLHDTLKLAYFRRTGLTDFPDRGLYVLRDISLLDTLTEEKMLCRELMSFGGIDPARDLPHRGWYPAAPEIMSRSGILAQMAHWPIPASRALGPSSLETIKVAATRLRGLMNRREALPHIYYVHCPDGRDRAGALSVWYLMADSDLPVSDAFMLGSSLNGSQAGS